MLTEQELMDLAKEELRRYRREWRKRNQDKIKEYNKRYWQKKALQRMQEAGEHEQTENK